MRQITIQETVGWIMAHRKKDAFKDYSAGKIAIQISSAISNNMFYYSLDSNEQLNGVVCCRQGSEDDTIFVSEILTTGGPTIIKKFMQYFISRFPNHKIVGNIRERNRVFNDPNKLYRRLK